MLDLDMDERRLVTRLLEHAYLELRSEIYKTDTHAMKDELRHEEAILARVLDKLGLHIEHPQPLRDVG